MKVVYVLLCAVSLFAMVGQADAGTLYGATASGGPGELYVLDTATGAPLQDVGPLNDVLGTNYPMTGMAFHPATGVLYGSTANNPAATAGLLVTINPATALVNVVGPFNVPAGGTLADLAFDANGNLYGVASKGGPHIYSVSTITGQATIIGNSGLSSTTGGGLAISDSGVFYGTPTASRYGTYDSGTGVYTDITNPVKPGGGGAYAALEFGDGGVLYGLNSAPGSPPPTYLVIIDPPTGTVTNLGQSVNAIDAIAWIPEPGTMTLLLGSVSIALFGKRRRRG